MESPLHSHDSQGHFVTEYCYLRQWSVRPGLNPRSSHTKDSKMVLNAVLLNTEYYKVSIKGKVEQSREEVAPSPTPWCSSSWKGSLRLTLDFTYFYYLLWWHLLVKSIFLENIHFWIEYLIPHNCEVCLIGIFAKRQLFILRCLDLYSCVRTNDYN